MTTQEESIKDVQITQIERLERWWAATALDGTRVNIFPAKENKVGTLVHFGVAGYREIAAMAVGDKLRWSKSPIIATLELTGKWWEIVAVEARGEGAQPDQAWVPNAENYRLAIKYWAWALVKRLDSDYVIFDTETTGVQAHDAIISAALLGWSHESGKVRFAHYAMDVFTADLRSRTKKDNILFKPYDWKLLEQNNGAAAVHGITADILKENGRNFGGDNAEGWDMSAWLDCQYVIGYNIQFDLEKVERELARHDMPPVMPLSTIDVMPHIAKYIGVWDAPRERWRNWKLSEAAQIMGVDPSGAHNALADCYMTLDLIFAMARDVTPDANKMAEIIAERGS